MSEFITNGELRMEAERLCYENERLESENAKLRELVRDAMRYYFTPSVIDRKQCVAALVKRAHELGVEEDDDELAMEVD